MKVFIVMLLICNILYVVQCSGAEDNEEKVENVANNTMQTEQKTEQKSSQKVSSAKGSRKRGYSEMRGRIIDMTDAYIMVKKGRTEIKLLFDANSKVFHKDGSEGSRQELEPCQYVKVAYKRIKKSHMVYRIVIEKESDCYK